jgi:hypothetical protein
MRVRLRQVAFARSGDKGDTANVGLIALTESVYPELVREVTPARVKEHFAGVCRGEVERFELPNLCALNFLLHGALGGGGTVSLMLDAQGKTFGAAILGMEIDVAGELVEGCARVLGGETTGRPGPAGPGK